MRKIVAHFFISLDGVVEAPHTWHFPYFNDEMGEEVSRGLESADAMLMGRKLYDEWSEYWPNQEEDSFADLINNFQKYVVSSTLEKAGWNNTTILNGDLVEEITNLKSQPGRDINLSGSPTLVRSLLTHGLLDELKLLIHPIIVGKGHRLFDGLDQIPLKVVSSTTLQTGVLAVRYVPADKDQ